MIHKVSPETCGPERYNLAEIDRKRRTCRPIGAFFFYRSRIGMLVHQRDTQPMISEQPGRQETAMADSGHDAIEEAA